MEIDIMKIEQACNDKTEPTEYRIFVHSKNGVTQGICKLLISDILALRDRLNKDFPIT